MVDTTEVSSKPGALHSKSRASGKPGTVHYFQPELNPRVMARYQQGTDNE